MSRGRSIIYHDPVHVKHREQQRAYRRQNPEATRKIWLRYRDKYKKEIYERRKANPSMTLRSSEEYRKFHLNYYGKHDRRGCKRKRWQDHEDYLVLTRNWNGTILTDKEIADRLERTIHAIDQRRHKLKEMGEQPIMSTIKLKFQKWLKQYEQDEARKTIEAQDPLYPYTCEVQHGN